MVFTVSSVAQLTEGDCLYSETALKLLMEGNELEGCFLLLFYCSYVVSSFIIQSVSACSSIQLVSLEILMLTLLGLYLFMVYLMAMSVGQAMKCGRKWLWDNSRW